MIAATSGLEGPFLPPGAPPVLGMHYKMSYAREQTSARAPARPVKPRIRSSKTDGHFDPDELSRRLYLVMADQRAHAERKRRARAEAAKPRETQPPAAAIRDGAGADASPRAPPPATRAPRAAESSTDLISELRRQKSMRMNAQRKPSKLALATTSSKTAAEPLQYHHVPREAARQFSRTTTVDGMRESGLVHKLSEQALKFHLDGVPSNRTVDGDPDIAPFETTKALQRGQSRRDKVYDRNQFQRTRILEEAAEVDEERERGAELQQRHTFQGERSRVKSDLPQLDPRRNSTGDVFRKPEDRLGASALVEPAGDVVDDLIPTDEPERTLPPEPRVDWTQSDEVAHRHKPLLSPLLRKADSIWALRGRLGSKGSSQEKSDLPSMAETPKSPKSPKAGFFAKFKR